jgi:hypothetical protein
VHDPAHPVEDLQRVAGLKIFGQYEIHSLFSAPDRSRARGNRIAAGASTPQDRIGTPLCDGPREECETDAPL